MRDSRQVQMGRLVMSYKTTGSVQTSSFFTKSKLMLSGLSSIFVYRRQVYGKRKWVQPNYSSVSHDYIRTKYT